jgi:hypothetical protein
MYHRVRKEEVVFNFDDIVRYYLEAKWDYAVASAAFKGFEPTIHERKESSNE